MGSIGGAEILVVLVIALLVLGPAKLPEAARQVGKAMAEFRRMSAGFQAEMRDAFSEPVPGTPPAPASSAEPEHEAWQAPRELNGSGERTTPPDVAEH